MPTNTERITALEAKVRLLEAQMAQRSPLNHTHSATPAPTPWPRGFLRTNDYDLEWASPAEVLAVGATLTHMAESFPAYRTRDIEARDLDRIRASLTRLRAANMQTVFRFSYWYHWDEPLEPAHRIDANLTQASRHVDQLATVLNAFTDVVLVSNLGFIGKWGEQHYYGMADWTKTYGERSLDQDPNGPRANLIRKVLRTWNMPISLRYVRDLRWAFERLGLSEAEKNRLMHNNDAVMASHDEWGTFDSEDDRAWFYNVYLAKPRIIMGEFGESTSFTDAELRTNLDTLARRDYRIHSWDSGPAVQQRLRNAGLWTRFERGVKTGDWS